MAEREGAVSDIALCYGGTNWSQTGQGTRPKTTSPTDGPTAWALGESPRGGERCTYGLESNMETETHVTDIFSNDCCESKTEDLKAFEVLFGG